MTIIYLIRNTFAPALLVPGLMLFIAGSVMAQGGPPANRGTGPCCTAAAPTAPLTVEEAKWMSFMREEEKLARDIYQQLYTKWNLRAFANIARSEQRHFDAIGNLIARYGALDPAAATPAGVYADPKLTTLYAELMSKARISLKDALEVGVLIEKTDIKDLEAAIKTDKTDLKTVYTNLLAGSLNHQEAFEGLLEAVAANQ